MLVLQLLWYDPCTTEVCNTTSSLPRPLHWSIVVDHREHWSATLLGPSGAVPTWPDGAWLDVCFDKALKPSMRHVLRECYPQHLIPTLILKWLAKVSNSVAKKQNAINMPKYPFCKTACDNSAHQCLNGESFLWSSSQPIHLKYNPWKLLHRWRASKKARRFWERLGPNAQVAQPANGIRQQKHLNTTQGHSASLPFSLASFCGRKQGLGDGEDWSL